MPKPALELHTTSLHITESPDGVFALSNMNLEVQKSDTVEWHAPDTSRITLIFPDPAPDPPLLSSFSVDINAGESWSLVLGKDLPDKEYSYSVYVHSSMDIIKDGGDPAIEITP